MGPLPHSGRPGLGPAGRMPHSGLGSPRSRHPGRLPTHPVPTSAGASGASGPGTEVAGTPERGPGACAGHGGEEGRGLGNRPAGRSGATVSPVRFSHRTQMRGICEDPSEISRPGSGEWTPRPLTSLSPLLFRTRDRALGHSTVDKFRFQSQL